MKIEKRISIMLAVSLAVMIAFGASLFSSYRQERKAAAEHDAAEEIYKKAFELNALAYDYFFQPTQRAREQWRHLFDSLAALRISATFSTQEQKDVLVAIGQKQDAIAGAFASLVRIHDEHGALGASEHGVYRALEARLSSYLLLEVQSVITLSIRLGRLSDEQARGIREGAERTRTLFFIALFSMLVANFFWQRRGIILPIRKLREGTEIIGGGNLEYRIGISTQDELGDLSRAFDRMTEQIRGSYETLKESEEKLKKHRDHLEELVEERTSDLSRAKENLERSNKELEQFAYVASHDLQEPLRMISSFLSLLEKEYRGRFSSEADEYINYAVDGATRLQAMIRDLLAFSRVSSRGNPLEPTDCEQVLRRALDNLKLLVEENGAEITHDPLPTVSADPTQLTQVLQNLIENSVKYRGEERPRIHVAAIRKDEDWLFSVADNGIGIDPKHREKIFQIFQRLHRDGQYAGTGIGLAVCRRIVERHGGRIWVESALGKGSVFYFTVPG